MTADAIKLYIGSIRGELSHVERLLDGGDETVRRNLIASIHNMDMRDHFNHVINLCVAIAAAEAGTVFPAPKSLTTR